MQPHESGALFGHAQRDAQRKRARQPTVIIRVPLVLEASYELYSDACGYSQRYNERVCRIITSVPVYNILDCSSAFGFERRFWLALPSISVSVCGKLTDAYSCPARLKKQALLRSLTAQGIKRE